MTSHSLSAWLCVGLFACAALPLCLSNYDHGRAFSDQLNYHYPTIVHFADGGGVADYPSATTPGYHLLLAAVAKWVSAAEPVLKVANSVITMVFVGLLAWIISAQVGDTLLTTVMVLPVLASIYVFPAGVWLLPDNLAWLSVLCMLYLAAHFRDSWSWYSLTALTLIAAVLIRQSNLWLCVVVFAVADKRLRGLTAATLVTLPAVAVLACFVRVWHGLTPPAFVERHTGLNLSAVPFFLCVLAFYSAFYLPLIIQRVRNLFRTSPRSLYLTCLGASAGFLTAVIAPTDWNPDEGRTSGLWNLAKMLPAVHHRSPSIAVLAALGGALAVIWLSLVGSRTRTVVVASAAGFVAAQGVSHFVYERYYAGMVFLLILVSLADVLATNREPVPRWALAAPCLFALCNLAILGAGLI
jgi:hypothetical protein